MFIEFNLEKLCHLLTDWQAWHWIFYFTDLAILIPQLLILSVENTSLIILTEFVKAVYIEVQFSATGSQKKSTVRIRYAKCIISWKADKMTWKSLFKSFRGCLSPIWLRKIWSVSLEGSESCLDRVKAENLKLKKYLLIYRRKMSL